MRLSSLFLAAIALMALALACGGGSKEDVAAGTCTAPAQAPEVIVKSYPQKPPLTIDKDKKYTATVKTIRGNFTIELLPKVAPEHVNSFVFLARDGYYNGVIFHRIEPEFVVQGGDPSGTGRGGPGYTIPLEAGTEKFLRGVLGMARSNDPNSAGSQWFVVLSDTKARHLEGTYTAFGKVTEGMDVVDCLAIGDAMIAVDIAES